MPERAVLAPGQGIQFHASLVTDDGRPVREARFSWKVMPEFLGRITEDGFFIAGHQPGEGRVIAITHLEGTVLEGSASVVVHGAPFFEVRVIPREAIVPPGGTQQFRVEVRDPQGNPVPVERVEWFVEPLTLGHIDRHGLFTAGPGEGEGEVVALVFLRSPVLVPLRGSAHVIVTAQRPGAIAGKVTAEDGQAIAGAVIMAQRIVFRPGIFAGFSKSVRTDSLGNYLMGGLLPGQYILRAEARGFVGEFYRDAATIQEATPVPVHAGETTSGIDFALTPGGAISGTVTAETTALPLEGAHVVAMLAAGPGRSFTIHTLTDSNGFYRIEGLVSGNYFVLASKEGYVPEFYNDARRFEDATAVGVTAPDETPNIDFSLATGSAILGKVVNGITGLPIARARVVAMALDPTVTPREEERFTDANGEYAMNLRPGRYLVRADAPGYVPEFYDDAPTRDQATPVEVREGEHTTGIDFDLLPLGAISGTVVEQSILPVVIPIPGAIVEAFPKDHPFAEPYHARTDQNGRYVLLNLLPGRYIVRAQAMGYLPEYYDNVSNPIEATPVTVAAGDTTENINFALQRGGAISGLVVSDAEGHPPIAGAVVQVELVGGGLAVATFTGRDGRYKIVGLPTGDYIVFASARGFIPEFFDNTRDRHQATRVHVEAPNETTDINFSLTPFRIFPGTGGIAGRVISEVDGHPIQGAVVWALPIRRGRPKFDVTGPEGFYLIDGLAPGQYFVLATARGYRPEFWKNATTLRQAEPVPVREGQVTGHIDFELAPRRAVGPWCVGGQVRSSADGTPIEGAVVYVETSEEVIDAVVADERGSFFIPDLAEGIYTVRGEAAEFEGASLPAIGIGNTQGASNVTLSLTPASATEVNSPEKGQEIPRAYALEQNYPNPFNPTTEIRYDLPGSSRVTLKVYNLMGQEIKTLVDGVQAAGRHVAVWDGTDNLGRQVASGIYLYRLETHGFSAMRKMVLAK